MLQASRRMLLIVLVVVLGGVPAEAAVRVSYDAAQAGSGVEPNEVTSPWVLYGTPMSNGGSFLLQNNTADDPTTESGEYLSPSAGTGLMTYGSGQYGIEFRVRPLSDVPALGSSHYANLAVTWSDSLYSYNVTIDKDTNDALSGTTGGLRYGQNSMINAVTGLDWSIPHTVFVGYRGSANAFDFYIDGTLTATLSGASMARSGSWARDAVDFGDGTAGQGLDISAEWYFVRVHDTPAPAPAAHVPFADANGDGDVDQEDFGAFQVCLSGTGGGIAAGCEAFDRAETGFPAGDRDVDQDDLDAFVQCYSGAGVPANPSCEVRTPAAGRNYLALYASLKATYAEVDALIAQAQSNGIGTLVPSLSGSGATVGFVTAKEGYLPELADRLAAGFDALSVMIERAHAAGLKVVPSVAVGPVNLMLFGHPEWETKDRNGQPSGTTMAPSLAFSYPFARQTKVSMLMDLVSRYNVDGVFLDYLRYPENTNAQHPEYACGFYGYDQPLIQQCIAQYGFDPRLETVGTSNWNLFNALRISSVTAFAQEFRAAVIASGRSIAIGGFGDSTLANDTCAARDWSAWAQGGYIDELWLGNYVVSISNMRQVLSQTRQLAGPNVAIQGALSPYAGFLSTNAQMVQAAREMLVGGADSLWVYREDALTANNLWGGAGLANEKYVRMAKLASVPVSQYDAVAAGSGVEPNEIAPAWVLSGSKAMVNNGSYLLQNNTSNPAAETGVYQSPVQSGLMLRSGGNYSIEFRVRPLADMSSTTGSSDYANLHLAWSDDVFQYSLAIDKDSDDAGAGVTGRLVAGGTATSVAVSGVDWTTPHTLRVVYDGVDAEFYFYLDGKLANALTAAQVQAGAGSVSLQDRVQFGDSTLAGNDSICEWYFVRVGANQYIP